MYHRTTPLGCACQEPKKLSGFSDFMNALIPGAKDVAKTVSALPGSQAEAFAKMISRIDVETAYGPPIIINDPFKPGPPNPYLSALKPRVTLTIADQKVDIAPYGAPGPTKWPIIATGAAVAGVLVGVWGVYRVAKLAVRVLG